MDCCGSGCCGGVTFVNDAGTYITICNGEYGGIGETDCS